LDKYWYIEIALPFQNGLFVELYRPDKGFFIHFGGGRQEFGPNRVRVIPLGKPFFNLKRGYLGFLEGWYLFYF